MTAKPLLAVARTDVVRIFVDVPEMESPWVEAGRAGYVSVQALPDRVVEGKVTRTSWALGANRHLAHGAGPSQPERPAAAGDVRHRTHRAARASRCLLSSRCRPSFATGKTSLLLDRQGRQGGANPDYPRTPGRQRRGGGLRLEGRRTGRSSPRRISPGRSICGSGATRQSVNEPTR